MTSMTQHHRGRSGIREQLSRFTPRAALHDRARSASTPSVSVALAAAVASCCPANHRFVPPLVRRRAAGHAAALGWPRRAQPARSRRRRGPSLDEVDLVCRPAHAGALPAAQSRDSPQVLVAEQLAGKWLEVRLRARLQLWTTAGPRRVLIATDITSRGAAEELPRRSQAVSARRSASRLAALSGEMASRGRARAEPAAHGHRQLPQRPGDARPGQCEIDESRPGWPRSDKTARRGAGARQPVSSTASARS